VRFFLINQGGDKARYYLVQRVSFSLCNLMCRGDRPTDMKNLPRSLLLPFWTWYVNSTGVHSKPSPTVSYRNDQLFLTLSLDFLGFNTRSCIYSMKTSPTELRQTMTCLIKDNIKRNESGMYTPSMIPVIGLMYIQRQRSGLGITISTCTNVVKYIERVPLRKSFPISAEGRTCGHLKP
jgi:hypothetical protein